LESRILGGEKLESNTKKALHALCINIGKVLPSPILKNIDALEKWLGKDHDRGRLFLCFMNDKRSGYMSAMKDELMYATINPQTKKMYWFSMKYQQTMYESPKRYRNDYAFNTHGTWLRFPTEYRTKDGRPKAILLRHKKDVVLELSYFCRFQQLIGVDEPLELRFHMSSFLANVVKIHDGVFDPTAENVLVLDKIAKRILESECKEETLERLKDDRKFCIDPVRLKGLGDSEKSLMRNKGKRFATYLDIVKKYDGSKSKAENAAICGVSESTIARFRRYRDEIERVYNSYFKIEENDEYA